MKKRVGIGAALVYGIFYAIIALLPEDTLKFSKGITALIASIPLIIGVIVITFTKICPSCGTWLAHIRKRRCSICGTEVK